MASGNTRGFTNPFYSSTPPPPTSPPPSYNHSASVSTSQGPSTGQPMQYSSLSDLTRGRAAPPQPPQRFDYQPQPERQGYRAPPPTHTTNDYESGYSGSGAGGSGRRVPPVPRDGMMPPVPPEPPRRTVAAPPVPPRQQTRMQQVQGYIPDRASNTVTSAADRMRDGFNSIATNERKDQVLGGLGKLGAGAAKGAAKLGAKGAYQLGKFASK
ncbi:hypothetical protein I317_05190 [Kwoniella heveanensis CBS 569]|uniref:Uncharacterized protein n=1 Tax=Kwoniella heveanensis BCC8398 TaxID=1296120 RepID=A0A1B9GXL6_9TREE|nr:hypothetical protein I316_02273 [Kwoniella heveanensis BCC8398]OCF40991.1 hypothetical protein I317_05190 [Kwoniella heveanensis CBS 569]